MLSEDGVWLISSESRLGYFLCGQVETYCLKSVVNMLRLMIKGAARTKSLHSLPPKIEPNLAMIPHWHTLAMHPFECGESYLRFKFDQFQPFLFILTILHILNPIWSRPTRSSMSLDFIHRFWYGRAGQDMWSAILPKQLQVQSI